MYLLDTDILIDIQRGHPPALVWFASLPELPSVLGFVIMELIQDAQNMQQVRKALKLVAPLPVVWATEADCARALLDFTTYHLSNSLGLLDALIGAYAVGQGATLCTFNVKHYPCYSWFGYRTALYALKELAPTEREKKWFFGTCYAEILTKHQDFPLKSRLTGCYGLKFSAKTQTVRVTPVIIAQ